MERLREFENSNPTAIPSMTTPPRNSRLLVMGAPSGSSDNFPGQAPGAAISALLGAGETLAPVAIASHDVCRRRP